MTRQHLTKLYNKLDIKDAEPNRFNVYTCDNGHQTKTVDRHYGVTPMFIPCPTCKARAASSFYKDIRPDLEPTHEWYVPSLEETLKFNKKCPPMVDHILRGGLEFRLIKR